MGIVRRIPTGAAIGLLACALCWTWAGAQDAATNAAGAEGAPSTEPTQAQTAPDATPATAPATAPAPAPAVGKGFIDFQTPGPETLVQRTEEENSQLYLRLNAKFMSPYCPGLVLRDCTSSGGQNLREQIRAWLQQGHTEEWITATMVSTYGESVLAAPPFRGAAVVVWIAPIVGLLVGGILLLRFLQAQKARHLGAAPAAGSVAPPTALDPDMDRRLEQEIQARAR